MEESDFLVVFTLDDQRYALPLFEVDRVVRMVAITSLPNAPAIILGAVNFQGRVIPVVNVRRRFCLPERRIALNYRMIVAHTARRSLALVVDTVPDVIACAAEMRIATESIVPGLEYVEGVVKLTDGLIFIHDLNKFLSLEEEVFLDQTLESA
ncbi:MAG: chemotaxis protein CheW [Burkholderiales bacterium]